MSRTLSQRFAGRRFRKLACDEGGAVALLAALTLTLLCGAVGLAIDLGVWYRTTRAMQNAADAAVVAAARDGGSSSTGKAVAARYGFVDGIGNITVSIDPCPSGGNGCYTAKIDDRAAPQFFSQVLNVPAPRLTVSATASLSGPSLHQYCILALAGSGTDPAIRTNGAPSANLNNCDILSNTGMTCNGHDLNAASGDAVLVNNGCGNVQNDHVRPVSDPYAGLAANIPSSGAPAVRAAAAAQTPPPAQTWTGNLPLPAITTIAGNLALGSDTTITTPAGGTVVYIQNGTLNLNGHTLATAAGSGLTIVFTGANGNSGSATPYPTGGGTLDITAPTSGPWSGIALYIDPRTTGPQDITYAGNSPTWKITGLVYMPHASFTVSGAVSKSSNGGACLALIIDNLRINGTGSILVRPDDCASAGVTLPTGTVPTGSPALVL